MLKALPFSSVSSIAAHGMPYILLKLDPFLATVYGQKEANFKLCRVLIVCGRARGPGRARAQFRPDKSIKKVTSTFTKRWEAGNKVHSTPYPEPNPGASHNILPS